MNIKKNRKDLKGLYIIALFLLVSLLLNVVLVKNIKLQEKALRIEYRSEINKKEAKINTLNNTITQLEFDIDHASPESKDNQSKMQLAEQNNYLNKANEFITTYLNYDTNTLGERRNKLSPMTKSELLNQVAPEESQNEENLSSDPTFSSTVKSLNTYISKLNEEDKTSEVIAEVSYQAKSTEGETTVNSIIKLQLQSDKEGIKVTEYSYYPIK